MACELLDCCQFFNDNMKGMPKAADYIKNNLCLGNHEVCNRFKIYKEFGGQEIPFDLDPNDTEEVKKVLQCLRKKQEAEGVKSGNNHE
jgi:hypothetical protein